jgi:hypothetical protein
MSRNFLELKAVEAASQHPLADRGVLAEMLTTTS